MKNDRKGYVMRGESRSQSRQIFSFRDIIDFMFYAVKKWTSFVDFHTSLTKMKANHIFKVPTSLEIEYLQLKFKPSNHKLTQNEYIRCSLTF